VKVLQSTTTSSMMPNDVDDENQTERSVPVEEDGNELPSTHRLSTNDQSKQRQSSSGNATTVSSQNSDTDTIRSNSINDDFSISGTVAIMRAISDHYTTAHSLIPNKPNPENDEKDATGTNNSKASQEVLLRRGESAASEPPSTTVAPPGTTYRQRSTPFPLTLNKSNDPEIKGTSVPRPPILSQSYPPMTTPPEPITSEGMTKITTSYECTQSNPPPLPGEGRRNRHASTLTEDSFQPVAPPMLRQAARNNTEESPGATAVYPNNPLRNAGFDVSGITVADENENSSLTLMRGESSSINGIQSTAVAAAAAATTEPVIMARLVRESEIFRDLELRRDMPGPPPSHITEALEVKEDEPPKRTLLSLLKDWRVIAVVLVLVGVIVGLTVGLGQLTQEDDELKNELPTILPFDNQTVFLKPQIIAANEAIVAQNLIPLLPPSSVTAISIPNSSHKTAADWLVENNVLKGMPLFRIVQRYVFAVLYFSTGGLNSWLDSQNWLSSTSECEWFQSSTYNGIEVTPCSTGSYVIETLVLEENRMFGSIPIDVALLSDLKMFALPSNLLQGQSVGAGHMLNLQILDLSSNSLSGELPALTNHSSLTTINFAGNDIEGTIPASYGTLKSLEVLNLGQNAGINGTLPESLIQLSNLHQFNIEGTAVTGYAPNDLCQVMAQGNFTVDCTHVMCSCCGC
jgi:hypothetical protein